MDDPFARGPAAARPPSDAAFDDLEREKTVRVSVAMLANEVTIPMTERAISIASPKLEEKAALTVLVGATAGEVFSITDAETVIGRDPDCQITLSDSSVSRRHTRLTLTLDGRCLVEDLNSTNGTYVLGEAISRTMISSGDRIQIGPNVVVRFAMTDETEESMMKRLYESSTRDALTGAFNRRYFTDRLGSELAYARRHSSTLAVLILDVDYFKRINDAHGHLAGDRVLRCIAERLAQTVRREDVFARLGGEEFAVLARSGSAIDAARLAERLRASVDQLRIDVEGESVKVTISVGVASLTECPLPAKDNAIIALADERLYRAKAAGRNRVAAG